MADSMGFWLEDNVHFAEPTRPAMRLVGSRFFATMSQDHHPGRLLLLQSFTSLSGIPPDCQGFRYWGRGTRLPEPD